MYWMCRSYIRTINFLLNISDSLKEARDFETRRINHKNTESENEHARKQEEDRLHPVKKHQQARYNFNEDFLQEQKGE